MPNTAHTPTPWQYDAEEGVVRNARNLTYRGIPVCDMRNSEAGDANAAFIVNACNSYDALVDALTELEAQSRERFGDTLTVRKARVALAKAKGE